MGNILTEKPYGNCQWCVIEVFTIGLWWIFRRKDIDACGVFLRAKQCAQCKHFSPLMYVQFSQWLSLLCCRLWFPYVDAIVWRFFLHYRPQRSYGKVMFSRVSVILSTGEGVSGRHSLGRHPLPWADPPPPADGYCSRRYTSYWNAFFFMHLKNIRCHCLMQQTVLVCSQAPAVSRWPNRIRDPSHNWLVSFLITCVSF